MQHHWKTNYTENQILAKSGFVYMITNLSDNRQYIGRKYTKSHRKVYDPVTKKSRKKFVESDWRIYTGSCKQLNEDISRLGHSKFSFEILSIHTTKAEVNYEEVRLQMEYDVLHKKQDNNPDEYQFYNSCINGKWYRPRVYQN